MLNRLAKRCSGEHSHGPLLAGRAKHAETYPMGLIVDILRGMRDENDRLPHDDDAEENAAMLAASLNSGFPRLYLPIMWPTLATT